MITKEEDEEKRRNINFNNSKPQKYDEMWRPSR